MISLFLQKFALKAKDIDRISPIDSQSIALYSILTIWLIACIIILSLNNFIIEISWRMAFASACWIAISGLLARRYGHPRIALFLEAMALPLIIGSLSVVSCVFMARISGDFVDQGLEAVDNALGFDWMILFRFYVNNPQLAYVSRLAYYSFALQIPLIPLLLFLTDRKEIVWICILAYTLALIAAIAIFPMFPAIGPYVRHGIKLDELPAIAGDYPWQWKFGKFIEGIRNGNIRDISEVRSGLVEMPSFHASAGVIFIFATRKIKFLWLPLLLLNLLMIFAAIIIGGHYLIDVIVGSAVGMAAVIAAQTIISAREKHPANSDQIAIA